MTIIELQIPKITFGKTYFPTFLEKKKNIMNCSILQKFAKEFISNLSLNITISDKSRKYIEVSGTEFLKIIFYENKLENEENLEPHKIGCTLCTLLASMEAK